MNRTKLHTRAVRGKGFTLIELLVVMGIVGVLAALIVSLAGNATASRNKARIRAEMAKLQTVIEAYKGRRGYYPPDNHLPAPNSAINPLYYELSGLRYDGVGSFTPFNGGPPIAKGDVQSFFGMGGFMNSTTDPQENPVFTHAFDPGQYGTYTTGNVTVNLLICPIKPGSYMLTNPDGTTLNPWHYVSSNPPNNPAGYDLWVDVIIRGKTNRFCNWNAEPIVL